MPERWTNRATSTLASGIDSGDTSCTVATGEGALFPTLAAGDHFWAVLEEGVRANPSVYEIVRVDARAGDVMTIVRAQQGTSAQDFSSGARFDHRVTARTLEDLRDELLNTRLLPPTGFRGAASATAADWGVTPETPSGAASLPALAATNQVTGLGRVHWQGTADSGTRTTSQKRFWRGNAANRGGFRISARTALAANNANTRMFKGLTSTDSFLTNAGNPSAQTATELVGIGFDDTSGTGDNLQLFHCDGGGVMTTVDTGLVRTTTQFTVMELEAATNASSILVRLMRRESTGTLTEVEYTLTTNIPASTTFLYWQAVVRGNGGANTGQLDLVEAEFRAWGA